jgi:hypothetical protein
MWLTQHWRSMTAVAFVAAISWPARGADPIQMLDKINSIEKRYEGTANDLLEFLADRFEVTFNVDRVAFAQEKLVPPLDRKIRLLPMPDISLETTLWAVFSQIDCVYEVRNGQIMILPLRDGKKCRRFPALVNVQPNAKREMTARIDKLELTIDTDGQSELKDVLQEIISKSNVAIVVDTAEFRRLPKSVDVWNVAIKLKATKAPLSKLLNEIADQLKAKLDVHGDHVRIVPRTPES